MILGRLTSYEQRILAAAGHRRHYFPVAAGADIDAEFLRRLHELDRAHRKARPRRYRSLVLRWLRTSIGRPRPVSVQSLPPVAPSQISLTFIGHASVLLRYASLKLLMDPMTAARLGPLGLVRRQLAAGISAADLHDVDVVLIGSHHPAHLHVPTLARIRRSATVVVPPGGAGKLSALGFDRVLELGADQSFSQSGVDVHTTWVKSPDGAGLGFVVRGDGPTIFACTRSGYCETFREIGARHQPDLAILPIGGYAPRSFRERHMSPLDALYAFEDLRARLLVPIHFGAFALSYEHLGDPPRWLADLVAERGLDEFVVALAPGESRLFTNPARARRPTPHAHILNTDLVLAARPSLALP